MKLPKSKMMNKLLKLIYFHLQVCLDFGFMKSLQARKVRFSVLV